MKDLSLDENHYSIPENWNELTIPQLRYLAKLVLSNISAEEIKLKMLLHCMNARVRKYIHRNENIFIIKEGKNKYPLRSEELTIIADMFSYLFEVSADGTTVAPKLTKSPFPVLTTGGFWTDKKFYIGPHKTALSDISYEQFVYILSALSLSDNNNAVDVILKVLYENNPVKPGADVTDISFIDKTIVMWFVLGSLDMLAEKFPLTFSGTGKGEGNVFEQQMRVIHTLADGKTVDKEAVKKGLLYDALFTLEIAAEQAEENK